MSCGRVFSRESMERGRLRDRTGAIGLFLLEFGGLAIRVLLLR